MPFLRQHCTSHIFNWARIDNTVCEKVKKKRKHLQPLTKSLIYVFYPQTCVNFRPLVEWHTPAMFSNLSLTTCIPSWHQAFYDYPSKPSAFSCLTFFNIFLNSFLVVLNSSSLKILTLIQKASFITAFLSSITKVNCWKYKSFNPYFFILAVNACLNSLSNCAVLHSKRSPELRVF